MSRLFEGIDLRTLLADLRCVKLDRLDRLKAQNLERKLVFDCDEIKEAWSLVRKHRKKLHQLHEARERAKVSNARRRLGLTQEACERMRVAAMVNR